MLLSLSHVSKFYGDRQVLSDVTFSLYRGDHVGLVGANGSGKSTLLKIIVGMVQADGGDVTTALGINIGYLPQTLAAAEHQSVSALLAEAVSEIHCLEVQMRQLERQMTEPDVDLDKILAAYATVTEQFELRGGYDLAHRTDLVLTGLAVADIERNRPISTLSGGEKTRLCLAALLLGMPDLLLLDEPTNHLDLAALLWLEEYLQNYTGGVLVVSHDRHFLNQTVQTILEVDEHHGQVTSYTGNYDSYAEIKAQARRAWVDAYEAQQAEIHELREVIKGKARQVSHNRPARDKDKFLKNFKRERVETAVSRNVSNAEERLRRIEADPVPEPPQPLQINPTFDPQQITGRSPLSVSGLHKAFAGRVVLKNVSFALSPQSRVVITGANGTGKSTLLRILAGQEEAETGSVTLPASVVLGYLDQEQEALDNDLTLFEAYRQGLDGHFEELKAALLRYHLFTWPELMKPVRTLSIGQKRKLQLARLMATGANLLLLDEPTNHISFDVLEEFEAALLAFPGPVLAVSHDRRFIERFADEVWTLENGELKRSPLKAPEPQLSFHEI